MFMGHSEMHFFHQSVQNITFWKKAVILHSLNVFFFLISSSAPRAPTHWKKGRILGTGAFGMVYQCYDQDTGMELAVKQVQLGAMNAEVSKVSFHLWKHLLLHSILHILSPTLSWSEYIRSVYANQRLIPIADSPISMTFFQSPTKF